MSLERDMNNFKTIMDVIDHKIKQTKNEIEVLNDNLEYLENEKHKLLYEIEKENMLEKFKVGDKVYINVQVSPYDENYTKIFHTIGKINCDDNSKIISFFDKKENFIQAIIFRRNSVGDGYFSNVKNDEFVLSKA